MRLSPGDQVGSYILRYLLGKGGMAEVWAAQHRVLGVDVALKVLLHSDATMQGRLLREGRAQAAMDHPNILPVRDIIDVHGAPGLILPLVRGPSLDGFLQGYRPSVPEAAALFREVVKGVAHAHQHGLVHRDLKPGNVLLEERWGRIVPRVADFGLVKDGGAPGQTRHHVGMGTLHYAAPEQLLDAAAVDQRADLFSLGVILVELLTGQRPFHGNSLRAQLTSISAGPDLIGVPEDWEGVCMELLEADPEHRAPNISVLQEQLEALRPPNSNALLSSHSALAQRVWELIPRRADGAARPDPGAEQETWSTFAPAADAAGAAGGGVGASGVQRPVSSHNLPAERDAFVGRDAELRVLGEALDAARLVTVLGAAGVGKTRVVLQLARGRLGDFPGGIFFCDLSDAKNQDGILLAVGQALDVQLGRSDPRATLGRAIRGRERCLLILDNFEQIAHLAEETLGAWLEEAPSARFLVTSRVLLDITGEQVVALTPLDRNAAVALFEARARAKRVSFSMDGAVCADVEELVEVLDCLPLAIELAAARIRMMMPAAILARMDQRFKLLRVSRSGTARRHATLQAAIDWSWDLLAGWEQSALAQCSVFEGGFTLEAAEAVVSLAHFADAPWPMDAVQALVDKSLLRVLEENALGEPRFGMLVSVQAYAAKKLAEHDPDGACKERHCAHFATLGEDGPIKTMHGHGGVARQRALFDQRENLQAALRHARACRHPQHVFRCAVALAFIIRRQGPIPEGAALLRAVLREPFLSELAAAERSRLQVWADTLEHQLSSEVIQARLESARAQQVPDAEAYYLVERGFWHYTEYQYVPAEQDYRSALEICRVLQDRPLEIDVLLCLGQIYQFSDQHSRAEQFMQQALQMARQIGYRRSEGRIIAQLGSLCGLMGRPEEERRAYEQALSIAQEMGDRSMQVQWLVHLSSTWFLAHDLEQALQFAGRSLRLGRTTGSRKGVELALDNIGLISFFRGDISQAVAHSRALVAACDEHNRVEFLDLLGYRLQVGGQIAEARATYAAALQLAREHSRTGRIRLLLWQQGLLDLLCGDHTGAHQRFIKLLVVSEPDTEQPVISTPTHDVEVRTTMLAARALCSVLDGEPEEGAALLAEAEAQVLAADHEWLGQFYGGLRGSLLLRLGRLDEAEAALRGAQEIASRICSRIDEGVWGVALAGLQLQRGDLSQTLESLNKYEAMLSTIEAPWLLGQLWCLRAQLAARTDAIEAARQYLQRAEECITLLPLLPTSELSALLQRTREPLSDN